MSAQAAASQLRAQGLRLPFQWSAKAPARSASARPDGLFAFEYTLALPTRRDGAHGRLRSSAGNGALICAATSSWTGSAPHGTWFSQQPGSKLVDAEAYVSRTALLDRDAAPGEGPWSRAPDDRKVMATAGETRHLLRAKAEGWTTADFKGTKEALKRDVLSSDSVASSPFGVDVGPDAILASLGAYHATYEPADVMIQDVVVGSGDDQCINQIQG